MFDRDVVGVGGGILRALAPPVAPRIVEDQAVAGRERGDLRLPALGRPREPVQEHQGHALAVDLVVESDPVQRGRRHRGPHPSTARSAIPGLVVYQSLDIDGLCPPAQDLASITHGQALCLGEAGSYVAPRKIGNTFRPQPRHAVLSA